MLGKPPPVNDKVLNVKKKGDRAREREKEREREREGERKRESERERETLFN